MYAGPPARHSRHMSEHTTHTPQIKRLERTSSDRMVAGVSGGLGRYFDLNPAVFRLALENDRANGVDDQLEECNVQRPDYGRQAENDRE